MKLTIKESCQRFSRRHAFTLGFLQQMCGTLGLCFKVSEDIQMDSLEQKSLFINGIVDTSPTVHGLTILEPLKLVCEFLCKDIEQAQQIRNYDGFELIKCAKFYAFHTTKQRVLEILEDINSVEKLQKCPIRDYRTCKKAGPVQKTLASLCRKFSIATPGNDKTALVQVFSNNIIICIAMTFMIFSFTPCGML